MDEAVRHHAPAVVEPELVFRALGDLARQRLLAVLLRAELNVSELVEVFGLPQSTISRHLKALREAGLIQDRPNGPSTLYAAAGPLALASQADATDGDILPTLSQWLRRQPIPRTLEARLERVLSRRTGDASGFFNRMGRRWDELRRAAFGDAFALEAFMALLPKTWKVADIGCGTGYLLPVLSGCFSHVTGVEPAESMLACAERRIAEHRLGNVSLIRGELASLPLPDASVDLAIAVLVLHHVPQPSEALSELARVVRTGGRLLIVEQQSHENQAFYERMQDLWWGFAPQELSALCRKAGFAGLHDSRLMTADSSAGADAPPLFVLTAERGDGSSRC